MTEVVSTSEELDELLRALEEGRGRLSERISSCDPDAFARETADGDSIKSVLERATDELNFYYGRLIARSLALPQPPCLQTADFASLREAAMSFQVALRRFGNLLHDLQPADLDKQAVDAEHGTYSLRQILGMSAAHYEHRRQQIERIVSDFTPGKRPRKRPKPPE